MLNSKLGINIIYYVYTLTRSHTKASGPYRVTLSLTPQPNQQQQYSNSNNGTT